MKFMSSRALLCLIFFCGIIFFFSGTPAAVVPGNAENPVYTAFRASGAGTGEIKVVGWAEINREFMSVDGLETIIQKSVETLGGGREIKRETRAGDFVNRASSQVKLKNNYSHNLSLTAQSLNSYSGNRYGSPRSYLVGSLKGKGKPGALDRCRGQIEKMFKEYGACPVVSMEVRGVLEGNLSSEEKKLVVQKILRSVDAYGARGFDKGDIVTVSAYSPLITDYVRVAGRKVNLHIALRYYGQEKRTHVIVGSPLLDGEY